MKTFSQLKKELFKDPKFKKAYDDLEPEFRRISLQIEKKIKKDNVIRRSNGRQLRTN